MCEHDWEVIIEKTYVGEPADVVMWCKECGAYKIDAMYDNRRIDHFSRHIRLPKRERN